VDLAGGPHRSFCFRWCSEVDEGLERRVVSSPSPQHSDSDSDEEFASPSYDELADLLKEYTQIIRKSKAKCDRLKNENESLNAKYDIVMKASDEMKEENKLCHPL
jgi:hypothetical protein